MMHVLEFTGSERPGVSLQLAQSLFSSLWVAFIPVLLLPVIFMILWR